MDMGVITSDLLENFKANLISNEKSKNTIDKYMRDVLFCVKFINGRDIDKNGILEYKAMLERNYAVTSANSMIASLNAFFRFVGWKELCVKQFKLQRKTYCFEESELTKQEYMALVRTAENKKNERLSLLIQTICVTGIRVSELEYITVEAVKRGEAIVNCKGKTRKVFLVSKLCKKLICYAKRNQIRTGPIFITKYGNIMSRSNIWREMKALCEQAGVNPQKVFPHNLRHLFARTFYGIEKDIAKLADILGHASINTTRIYIVTTGAEHRQKLENMRLIT